MVEARSVNGEEHTHAHTGEICAIQIVYRRRRDCYKYKGVSQLDVFIITLYSVCSIIFCIIVEA